MSQLFTSQKATLAKTTEAVKVGVASKTGSSTIAKKVAVVSSSVAALTASSPAFALVEQVMATEGTHQPFGINEPIYFWLGIGVFGTIWALYASGIKDFGNADGKDS